MRCMSCGDNMILAEAFPAETGLARGFENQNLQCPGCGTTERRFVFAACATSFSGQAPKKATAQSNLHPVGKSNGASGVPAFQDLRISIFDVLAEEKTSASALQSQVGDSLTENVTRAFGRPRTRQEIRAPEASCPSSKAWERAVEKFLTHQADVRRRAEQAEKAKKRNSTVAFNNVCEGLPAGRCSNGLVPKLPAKAIRRFDEVWDGIGPSHAGPLKPEVSTRAAPLGPLPKSKSLVVIQPVVPRNIMLSPKSFPKKVLQKLFDCLQGALR